MTFLVVAEAKVTRIRRAIETRSKLVVPRRSRDELPDRPRTPARRPRARCSRPRSSSARHHAAILGRLRSCGAGISWVYPGVELTTALLIAGCVWKFGLTWEAVLASAFCAALVAVSAIDLAHRIVPNRIVVPGAVAILAAQTLIHPSPEWALGALGASGFLFAAAVVYPAGMGIGDVKLALMLGAMLGRTTPVGMMIG